MSNFDRGFFNNEDVSSSIKFAVLAILNRGNADEYYRGVNGNVPVIMANFPVEYGISSFAFDVGNESVSNGNLLIKVKENEYTTNSFDCVGIIESRVDDSTVLHDSINQILTARREQLNNDAITAYVPALKEKLDRLNKVLREKDINVVVHIINGLPYETKEMMIETAKYLNELDIQGVKIHMLHIIKNTDLLDLYEKEHFHVLSKEEYVEIVCEQLRYLRPEIVINRITGDPKVDDLIEPKWLVKKFCVLNDFD